MVIKNQIKTIKDNWLIALILLVLVGFVLVSSGLGGSMRSAGYKSYSTDSYGMAQEMAVAPSMARSGGSYDNGDFAPDVEERQIIKTTSMSNEVKRGTFSDATSKLRSIVTLSNSFILNENVNKYGTDRRSYMSGSFQIKVEVDKYNSVVAQLKDIGEVQSFYENSQDVTGIYTDLNVELAAEKTRLQRYQSMYAEATDVNDKINLNDMIFDQERRVKYLERQISGIDKRVEYSTISVSINEKRSDYADIALVKFSQLIENLVASFNSLFHLLFYVLPYAVAALIIWIVYRAVKKRA